MGAFLSAGIVFVCTVLVAALVLFAGAMADSPSQNENSGAQALGIFVTGCIITALLFGSHWVRIGW